MGFNNPISIDLPASNNYAYGTGADGAITFSANATLTRDLNATTITVNTGVTVRTNGYVMRASVGIVNNGTIHNDGLAGTASNNAATGGPGATLGSGGYGGYGNNGAETPINPGLGGRGGGTYNTGSGSETNAGVPAGGPLTPIQPLGQLSIPVGLRGGGGGATVSGQGMYAGGGGGVVFIATPSLTNNGVIRSAGGPGQDVYNVDRSTGAGGGGVVIVLYGQMTGTGTITAPPGYQNPLIATAATAGAVLLAKQGS